MGPENPDVARRSRPQHTSCRTVSSPQPREPRQTSTPRHQHILQECPLFTAQRTQTWLKGPDLNTHPAGLSPLHSPENPDLARRSRPQHTSCRTVPSSQSREPRGRPQHQDINTSCRAVSSSQPRYTILQDCPLFSAQRNQTWLKGQTSAHILQDCLLFTVQRTQTSTHPAGLSPLHSPENPGADLNTHPVGLSPLHSPENPDLAEGADFNTRLLGKATDMELTTSFVASTELRI